jgi:uncharacterized repeat protein (TIGR01451 family)
MFVVLLFGLWLVPNTASAFNCTFTATINENSGANFLYFGNSTSGNNADACLDFGFVHTTSGSSALGSWTSTGAGTNGGTQGPDNQITYTPAAGAVGNDSFSIAADGDAINDSTLAVTITIAAIPPSVSSVSPPSGSTSGGTSVTITGTAVTGATGVTVGGAAATNVTVVSDTTITATTPAGSAGTVDIKVTTAGGTSPVSANDRFTYIAPPTVSSVSPSGGPTAGGTTVTIAGTNFAGVTAVSFGATSATGFTVNGATSITATAPAHAAGQVDVTVTAGSVTSAISAADHYTYAALPTATQAIASTTLTQNHAATSFIPVIGSGGTGSLSYTVSPSLPTGLSMAPATGAITGTPTVTSSATTYTVTVTDTNSATATATFSLTVNSAVTATQAIASAMLTLNHAAMSFTPITGLGGTGPLTYSVSPSLPTGLSMTPGTGAITGTPAVASAATTYTVTVTDANGQTATATFALTVNSVVTATQVIASTTLTANAAATSFTPVTGSGGTTPLAYSVSPGLPTGLSMAPGTGAITGTPSVTSSATTYTVTVTDANSVTATATFGLTVVAPTPVLAVAVSGSPASVVPGNNITYSIALTVSTGTAINASLSDPLPAGLTFVSASETGPGGAWICTTPAVGGAGTVTCAIASAAPGTYSFTIVAHVAAGTPAGPLVNTATANAGNATTTSGSATNAIGLTTTSTTLVSSLNPSLLGQTVIFTATVSGSSPTGTVTFRDGATTLGTGTPNGSGVATFTTAALASGSHAVTAVYGDANNASSTSSVLTQSVSQTATAVAVTSSVNPSAPGQPVTFTATVTSAGGTPAGTVTFSDGGAAIGTGSLAGGVATFTTAALAAGAHNITVSYSGATGFAASASSALTQTVAIPADSIKLRQLQVAVTKVVAQNSGQAITGAIDTAITDGFSDGGGLVTPSGTGLRFNFSADPDQPGAADHERAFSDRWNGMFDRNRTAGEGGANNYARNRQNPSAVDDAFAAIDRNTMAMKTPPPIGREPKEWLLWADVRGSGVDRWGSTLGVGQSLLYGSQVNALLGLTRKVTPTFMVGIVGGYETFDYTSQDLSGKLKGNGWTVGSYLGWKLTSSIRFDAAVAYSGIGYDGTAGTAQGNFDGRRWMVSSGLTGNYKTYGFDVEPSAKIYALWEHENAYTDSLGTHQADHDFATGRASGGVKLSYPLAWTDNIAFAPYVGIYGDYYFTDEDAAAIVAAGALPLASTPLLDGWSARSTAGFAARFASGAAISVGGELGGIGSDTRIWTYRARAAVPF